MSRIPVRCLTPNCLEVEDPNHKGSGVCFRHRLLTVGISGTATPSRYKGGFYQDPGQWDRDLRAYETARKAGVEPEHSTEVSSRVARRAAGDFETAVA